MIEEIEIKYRLDSQEALSSLEKRANEIFPGRVKEVEQTNFFFDTPEFDVRKNGIGIRLRKEDARYFMTLKGPSAGKKESELNKLTSRLEFEAEITEGDAKSLLDGLKNPITVVEAMPIDEEKMRKTRSHLLSIVRAACPKEDIALVGSFQNRRRILPVVIGGCDMKLEFDRTHFPDSNIHFEVELEIPSMDHLREAEDFLLDLFNQCGQKPGLQKSKSERFYAFLTKGKER
jgi:uncharacterized protein YjbK